MIDAQQAPPPNVALFQMMFGRAIAHAISGVARLGIADHMSETPASAAELAARAGVHEGALYRVLRALSAFGVFAATPDGFALTPIGRLLRTSEPGSLRNMVTMFGDHWITNAYQRIDHCIRTGGDGVTAVFGKQAFEHFRDEPEQGERFNRAMTDFTIGAAMAMLDAYDFSRFRRMADVGGGHGVLLAKVLERYPAMRGVLFDLEQVLTGAPATGHFAACAGRVEYEAGSFLDRVPTGCDAYIMKHIVHDWDDASCQRILGHMREALIATDRANGRVFLLEMVVPGEVRPGPELLLDLEMLVATPGGRERTRAEFEKLFAGAGLEMVSIAPTETPMCVIEARVP